MRRHTSDGAPAGRHWPGGPLAGGAVWLATLSALVNLSWLPRQIGLGIDFSVFYAAALMVARRANPYDAAALARQEALVPLVLDPHQHFVNPYLNPPLFAWLIQPLTAMPLPRAYLLWQGLLAACLLATAVLLARFLAPQRQQGWVMLALCVWAPASVSALFLGQPDPLLALALVVFLVLARQGRFASAGTVLVLGWLKPHVFFPALLFAVLLLPWRVARRVVVGLAVATALAALLTWSAVGGTVTLAWLHALVSFGRTASQQENLSSAAGLANALLGGTLRTVASLLLIALWVSGAALTVWRARRAPLEADHPECQAWIGIALASWLFCTPYAHPQDLVLLLVALPIVLAERAGGRPGDRRWVQAALIIFVLAPECDLLLPHPPAVTYSTLVPLVVAVALWPHRGAPRATSFIPPTERL